MMMSFIIIRQPQRLFIEATDRDGEAGLYLTTENTNYVLDPGDVEAAPRCIMLSQHCTRKAGSGHSEVSYCKLR